MGVKRRKGLCRASSRHCTSLIFRRRICSRAGGNHASLRVCSPFVIRPDSCCSERPSSVHLTTSVADDRAARQPRVHAHCTRGEFRPLGRLRVERFTTSNRGGIALYLVGGHQHFRSDYGEFRFCYGRKSWEQSANLKHRSLYNSKTCARRLSYPGYLLL